jgi:arylsulfatase A-like enzyme
MSRSRAVAVVAGTLLVVAAILVIGRETLAKQQAASVRPNVLLIVADDMRHDGLWVMPTIGQFADRGVTFNQAFATTPLCCPSRASILTGQYARNHGVRGNDPPLGGVQAFDDDATLATWVQSVGARTGLVGRYLNGYASRRIPPGWDYWFAIWPSSNDVNLYYRYLANHNGQEENYGGSSEKYSTRVIGQRALAFLRGEDRRPFLLLVTPRAPHGPATPDVHDVGALKDLDLPRSPAFDEEDVGDKPTWIRETGRLGTADREAFDRLRQRQLESLLSLDRAIASIVDLLREDGRLDHTWIIFTSDNGLSLGEHRLDVGKSCPYEECVRVPLVIVPPGGLPTARTEDRLVANIDLAPTIAAIMGAEPTLPQDGRSLVPMMLGHPIEWRDGVVLEQWGSASAGRSFAGLRTLDRKYVRHENGEEELYDETADPYELQNLAADPAWSAEKDRLAARLQVLLDTPPGHADP